MSGAFNTKLLKGAAIKAKTAEFVIVVGHRGRYEGFGEMCWPLADCLFTDTPTEARQIEAELGPAIRASETTKREAIEQAVSRWESDRKKSQRRPKRYARGSIPVSDTPTKICGNCQHAKLIDIGFIECWGGPPTVCIVSIQADALGRPQIQAEALRPRLKAETKACGQHKAGGGAILIGAAQGGG